MQCNFGAYELEIGNIFKEHNFSDFQGVQSRLVKNNFSTFINKSGNESHITSNFSSLFWLLIPWLSQSLKSALVVIWERNSCPYFPPDRSHMRKNKRMSYLLNYTVQFYVTSSSHKVVLLAIGFHTNIHNFVELHVHKIWFFRTCLLKHESWKVSLGHWDLHSWDNEIEVNWRWDDMMHTELLVRSKKEKNRKKKQKSWTRT